MVTFSVVQIGENKRKTLYRNKFNFMKLKDDAGVMQEIAKACTDNQVKSKSTKEYIICIGTARQYAKFTLETLPTPEDIQAALTDYPREVKDLREQNRKTTSVKRSRLNGAIVYELVGGVFMEKEAVIRKLATNLRIKIIDAKKTPANSKNHVGIELEFNAKINIDALKVKFAQEGLHKYVNIGTDGSVTANQGHGEKHYPMEMRCIIEENEVKSVMTRICAVLNSKEVGAYVNDTCGLHVHIDSRNRNPQDVYRGLVRGLPLLKSMVPNCRHKSTYCKTNTSDVMPGNNEAERYMAINSQAFYKYSTIEVRLHSGSTNAKKIINWVTILVALATKNPANKITNAETFAALDGNSRPELYKYIEERCKKFTSPLADRINTEMDDVTDFMTETA